MEKDRGTRVIAILALVIGVVGLSIGFAAFSSNLKIEDTSATVTPDQNDFRVLFTDDTNSTLLDAENKGTSFPANITKILTSKSDGVTAATTVTIDNTSHSAPKISGLSAGFTNPGQSIVYTFYAKNVGEYDAYLKTLSAEKADASDYITCTAKASSIKDTSQDLIDAACATISATVTVYTGSDELGKVTLSKNSVESDVSTTISSSNMLEYDPTQEYHKIVVEINYGSTAEKVDEEFNVEFGDVTLGYSSVN